MALLIPVLHSVQDEIKSALRRFASYDWASKGKIFVLPIEPDELGKAASERIAEFCQANNVKTILLPARLHCKEQSLRKSGYKVINGPSIEAFVQGTALLDHLREMGLDWRTEVIGRLQHYALAPIGLQEVERWLGQFERLGNHRAVGEHLLQLLDVLPLAELGDALCGESDFFGNALVIGFNNDKWGKSWSTITNLIRKKCSDAVLLPINEAIEKAHYPKVLRLVEDGLFTGTEVRAIFDSLRGVRPENRSQKVPKLSDPSILQHVSAQIHFGAVCDFGEAVLRGYMAENSLLNVQIVVGASARKIRVLTNEGPNGLSEQGKTQSTREKLRARVRAYAFQGDKGWKSDQALLRAQNFCQLVGEQLWRNYIISVRDAALAKRIAGQGPQFDLDAWPPDRVTRCALGMEGLGLTFAFPHSMPKSSLPVFWGQGQVRLGGDCLDWEPLLPNNLGQ
jgi:hypothetical protein